MARPFHSIAEYRKPSQGYHLLPFRFTRFDSEELLVNEVGEHLFAPGGTVSAIVKGILPSETDLYRTLKAKQFLYDDDSAFHFDLLAAKYRTKKAFLSEGSKLHLVVLTLRCEHSCHYCQVSRQTENRFAYDMTKETLNRAVALIMASPSPHLTIEFQGGEPLLAFDALQYAVAAAKELAAKRGKILTLVVATNLAVATDEMLRYLRDENVLISTSLDGPAHVHNANRPRAGNNSYETTIRNIRRARDHVGHDRVSALVTATRYSLDFADEIVDEYARQGFGGIFIRSLSPFGFAVKTNARTGYSMAEFLRFYQSAFERIIAHNRAGQPLTEIYAKLLLTRILTPFSTGYVDLQSPAGAGLSVRAYNYDGYIYASDEGRMLAETNDHTCRLGHVATATPTNLLESEAYQYLGAAACNEALPGCRECAFQPYCGADPVVHHATQGDAFGHRPTSVFCQKHMGLFRFLFERLRGADPETMRIFWSWITDRKIEPAEPCV